LLLRFVPDGAGVVEHQPGFFDGLDLAVALGNESADNLLRIVCVHLATEGFQVERLPGCGHWSSIAQGSGQPGQNRSFTTEDTRSTSSLRSVAQGRLRCTKERHRGKRSVKSEMTASRSDTVCAERSRSECPTHTTTESSGFDGLPFFDKFLHPAEDAHPAVAVALAGFNVAGKSGVSNADTSTGANFGGAATM